MTAPLERSDHIGLTWKVNTQWEFLERTECNYMNFWKGDYLMLNEKSSHVIWANLSENWDVSEMWRRFSVCMGFV